MTKVAVVLCTNVAALQVGNRMNIVVVDRLSDMQFKVCNCHSVTKTETCFKLGDSVFENTKYAMEICKTDLFEKPEWMLHHDWSILPKGAHTFDWLAQWICSQDTAEPLRLYWPAGMLPAIFLSHVEVFDDFHFFLNLSLEDTLWKYRRKSTAKITKLVRRDIDSSRTVWKEEPFLMGVFFHFEPVGIHDLALG